MFNFLKSVLFDQLCSIFTFMIQRVMWNSVALRSMWQGAASLLKKLACQNFFPEIQNMRFQVPHLFKFRGGGQNWNSEHALCLLLEIHSCPSENYNFSPPPRPF